MQTWDMVVIGAGPAGSTAARLVARRGASVLLVDKARFPRDKVCGCCLNRAAVADLRAVGLGHLTRALGARPIERLRLFAPRARCTLALPGGACVSRRALDMALVDAAEASGARFEPMTVAKLDGADHARRGVTLRRGRCRRRVRARLVLAADGLAGASLTGQPTVTTHVLRASYIGLASIADVASDDYRAGEIYMACGRRGYVGLVRLEDGRLNIAAAVDPSWVRQQGGPAAAVERILLAAGLPPVPRREPWQGTRRLTCCPAPPAAYRLLALGDAAGYVEPFTGEGIAWALAGARAVAPLACHAIQRWDDALTGDWARLHGRLIGQRRCRLIARLLRQPTLTMAAIRLFALVPAAAQPLVRSINAPLARRSVMLDRADGPIGPGYSLT